jgi:transposase-like protein
MPTSALLSINTLQQAIQKFSDEQTCIDTVAAMRWPDGVTCPACGHKEHWYLKTQKRWKCKDCHRQFSVKLGTIFEDSPIGLDKWLLAMWMLASCKNGVSSYEIHRAIGVTQKTAWFMLHRLRLGMKEGKLFATPKLGGKLLKRNLSGTYVCVEPFHLDRYVDEQVFRFNNRGNKENPINDGERFRLLLSQIAGKRLTYSALTGKDSLPTPEPF